MAVAASFLMLHSCSNDEALPGEQAPAVYIPGDSEVEIKLGAGSVSLATGEVRAAVTGDDADLDHMGIFCLAKAKQDADAAIPDIAWFGNSVKVAGCIMDNVEAKKEGQNISWLSDVSYFYPISQFYTYDFYGYYPYAKEAVAYTDNSVRVQYTLDGTQDLIWGRATSSDPYAYSAKYFRTEETHDVLPQLELKHLLTRLQFFVKPGADLENGDTAEEAAEMQVTGILVTDAHTEVDMIVADYQQLNMPLEARLALRSEETDTVALCNAEGLPFDTIQVGGDLTVSQQAGESMMLYPASEYTVRIFLRNGETGHEFIIEKPLALQAGGFKAGTTYKITVTVHGPNVIGLQATLAPWVPSEGDNPEIEL